MTDIEITQAGTLMDAWKRYQQSCYGAGGDHFAAKANLEALLEKADRIASNPSPNTASDGPRSDEAATAAESRSCLPEGEASESPGTRRDRSPRPSQSSKAPDISSNGVEGETCTCGSSDQSHMFGCPAAYCAPSTQYTNIAALSPPTADTGELVAELENVIFSPVSAATVGGWVRARSKRILSALRSNTAEPSRDGVDLLRSFCDHENWELSHDSWNEEEALWLVHAIHGGRNDREWTLIGSGETPSEAIRAALNTVNDGGQDD